MSRQILLDADGVLCDFVSAACEVHGHPNYAVTRWNFHEDWGITEEDFWRPIRALGTSFYRYHVQPYPWMTDLIQLVRSFGDVTIASVAGAGTAEDYYGKVAWVKEHVGDIPVIMLPPGHKHRLAEHGTVLIDDSDTNCGLFHQCGGRAIVFPQPWNVMSRFSTNRLAVVYRDLEFLCNSGGKAA